MQELMGQSYAYRGRDLKKQLCNCTSFLPPLPFPSFLSSSPSSVYEYVSEQKSLQLSEMELWHPLQLNFLTPAYHLPGQEEDELTMM